jgi:hypothetical protein
LRIVLKGLNADRLSGFNSGNDLLALLDELRWTLGSSASLLVNQVKESLERLKKGEVSYWRKTYRF